MSYKHSDYEPKYGFVRDEYVHPSGQIVRQSLDVAGFEVTLISRQHRNGTVTTTAQLDDCHPALYRENAWTHRDDVIQALARQVFGVSLRDANDLRAPIPYDTFVSLWHLFRAAGNDSTFGGLN